MKRMLSMILALVLLLSAGQFRANANSGPEVWTGTTATGAVVTGASCPIAVEHESLIFDIQEFPREHYDSPEAYRMYSGKVTAEYTFYNPTDYQVTATLVFPFGLEPNYAYYDHTDPDSHHHWAQYGVSANDQPIEATVRHTLACYGHEFSMEEDLALLHEGFAEDPFYRPDLPVTRYTYQVSGVDLETYDAAFAGVDLSGDPSRTKTYLAPSNGGDTCEGFLRVGGFIGDSPDEERFTLYVMGEPLESKPVWRIYENGGMEQEIGGTVELVETETMTLYDMIMVDYDPDSGILEHDWYNALITSMNRSEWSYGHVGPEFAAYDEFDISRNLMRWYEYELVFQPGQRVVNVVTAPIYPDIWLTTEPYTYEYTYLLSPAAEWADFGTLDITVNTPFYMVESTDHGFNWDNPGYSLQLDGLPEGELEFVLCQSRNPRRVQEPVDQMLTTVAAGLVIAILAILIMLDHSRKKKAE